jgi:alcohol/geraniol dehydrogenase (NADP+)
MGAGVTVFSALYNFDIKPSDKIAIVGLGGVGHLAVQFARKWGCRVTVLSTSESKREDAMKLGANVFCVTQGDWTKGLSVDVLLMVANIKPDKWDEYISILKPRGKIILVTAGSDTLGIPVSDAGYWC